MIPENPVTGKRKLEDVATAIAQAITEFETGARPFTLDHTKWKGAAGRNMNPGNLRRSSLAVGIDQKGYAIFNSVDKGWQALLDDITSKLKGRTRTGLGPNSTIESFIYKWAPPSDNNPTNVYVQFISDKMGVSPQAKFSDWVEYA
jgi:hypothetical protein